MYSSTQRAKASRLRKKDSPTLDERTWLAAYDARGLAAPAEPAPTVTDHATPLAAPIAAEPAADDAAAALPSSDSSGSGSAAGSGAPAASAAPPLQLEGLPEPQASPADAQAAAERQAMCQALAAQIVAGMRAVGPTIEAANKAGVLGVPQLPALAYPVLQQAWVYTLERFLPQDVDPRAGAPYIAVAGSVYQFGVAGVAASRLSKLPKPAGEGATSPSSPAAAAPSSPAPSSPAPFSLALVKPSANDNSAPAATPAPAAEQLRMTRHAAEEPA